MNKKNRRTLRTHNFRGILTRTNLELKNTTVRYTDESILQNISVFVGHSDMVANQLNINDKLLDIKSIKLEDADISMEMLYNPYPQAQPEQK